MWEARFCRLGVCCMDSLISSLLLKISSDRARGVLSAIVSKTAMQENHKGDLDCWELTAGKGGLDGRPFVTVKKSCPSFF